MKRNLLNYLNNWHSADNRKPLVIRGARQVGKTWMVRYFAEAAKKELIELNFEKNPSYAEFFSVNDPKKILFRLSASLGKKIDPENSLLFLDEIQAAPQLFAKLRWFAEDLPVLPVITTGSLLEFVLKDHDFSMPVGRISYAHLEPLSFEEFLIARDQDMLLDFLSHYEWSSDIPNMIHQQAMELFKEYLLVGGLPAAVGHWATHHSLDEMSTVQNDLLATYRGDFDKYRKRVPTERLEETMMAIPGMLGQKFICSRVNASVSSTAIKQALSLLEKARVIHRVRSGSANGVPLGAEIKEKYFKEIFLDVGLCSSALGLSLDQVHFANEIDLINSGGIAEQVVGQMLRTINPPYIEPALYCWHREEVGSNAEIDYIIQHGTQIIPIEVKAGATGSLKSLHLFMHLKKLPLAIRINSDLPSRTSVNVKDHAGNPIHYQLLSLPFYLVGQIHRLIKTES